MYYGFIRFGHRETGFFIASVSFALETHIIKTYRVRTITNSFKFWDKQLYYPLNVEFRKMFTNEKFQILGVRFYE